MTNYPVGDFLIRIKNAVMAKNHNTSVVSSKLVLEVAKKLKKEGYLDEVEKVKNKINVRLKYHKKEPVILNLKLISKPGLRIYMSVKELEKKKGPSIYLISTAKGILTTREAIKKRIGGEVIVEIL